MALHKECIEKLKEKLEKLGLILQLDEGFMLNVESGENGAFYSIPTKTKKGLGGSPVIIQYCPLCGKEMDNGSK